MFFEEMIARAQRGDQAVLAQLRSTLREHPELWQPIGDLTGYLKAMLIEMIAGQDVAITESLYLRIEKLSTDLVKNQTSPAVQLVAEQVAIAWLDLHHQQLALARSRKAEIECKVYEQGVERAEKRYFAAIEMVTKLQKLLDKT